MYFETSLCAVILNMFLLKTKTKKPDQNKAERFPRRAWIGKDGNQREGKVIPGAGSVLNIQTMNKYRNFV